MKSKFRKTPYYTIIMTILSFFSPILALPILFYEMVVSNEKEYYFLFSISLGMLAFHWQPELRGDLYDLIRYHTIMVYLDSLSFSEFLQYVLTIFKPIQFLLLKIMSLFNNPNNLQLLVTSVSIYLIMDIVRFYSDKYSAKDRFLLLALVLSTIRVIMIISGLWNELAVFIAVYALLRVEKKGFRILLYLISLGIHFSMIFPLSIFLLLEYFRTEKLSNYIIPVLLISLTPFVFVPIVNGIYQVTNIEVLKTLLGRFNAYVVNQGSFEHIHNFRYYILEISKPIFIITVVFINNSLFKFNEDSFVEKFKNSNGFKEGLLIAVIVLVMGLRIRILTRFTTMAFLLFIPYFIPLIRSLSKLFNKKNRYMGLIFNLSLHVFILLQMYYQINSLYHAHFFDHLIFVFR